MRQQAITVELPEEVYERVKRTARGMRRPVEQALVRIVKAAMPSLDKVPPEYRPELEALEPLSDEELWRVAESQVPTAQKRQLTRLLRKNQRGALTDRERQALTRLRTEADRLMLHRSYAGLGEGARSPCTISVRAMIVDRQAGVKFMSS
jgi:hypothetical protein